MVREEIFLMTQTEVTSIAEETITVEKPIAIATEPPSTMEQFVQDHQDNVRLPKPAEKADELLTTEDEIVSVRDLDDTPNVTSVGEDNDDVNFAPVKIYRFLFGYDIDSSVLKQNKTPLSNSFVYSKISIKCSDCMVNCGQLLSIVFIVTKIHKSNNFICLKSRPLG